MHGEHTHFELVTATVTLDELHTIHLEHPLHAGFPPRGGSCRVLMNEKSPFIHLNGVQLGAEAQMHACSPQHLSHAIWVNVPEIEIL